MCAKEKNTADKAISALINFHGAA